MVAGLSCQGMAHIRQQAVYLTGRGLAKSDTEGIKRQGAAIPPLLIFYRCQVQSSAGYCSGDRYRIYVAEYFTGDRCRT